MNDKTINTNNYIEGNVTGGNIAGRDFHITNHNYPAPEKITLEVDLYHLPKPTTALIGRKTELAQLTEAIKNPLKRLAIVVAAGGIGKSALTDEWLQQIAQENYYGKTRVFGWSFYSQGSHNTFTNVSAVFATTAVFADSRWFRAVAICAKSAIHEWRIARQRVERVYRLFSANGEEKFCVVFIAAAVGGIEKMAGRAFFVTGFENFAASGRRGVVASVRRNGQGGRTASD
jgi:hypothetical protein